MRIPSWTGKAADLLHGEIGTFQQDGIEAEFVPTKGIGGILVLRGDVSSAVTDSNPIREGRPLMEVLPLRPLRRPRRLQDGRRSQRVSALELPDAFGAPRQPETGETGATPDQRRRDPAGRDDGTAPAVYR